MSHILPLIPKDVHEMSDGGSHDVNDDGNHDDRRDDCHVQKKNTKNSSNVTQVSNDRKDME